MRPVKTITIDQLTPGMFIVGMDQAWYRTPFLIHKRLIRHTKDIDLLRQYGIREVKIDPSQGLDVEPVHLGDGPLLPNAQVTDAPTSHKGSPEEALQPASSGEPLAAQPLPLGTQKHAPMSSHAEQTVADPTQSSHPVEPASPEEAPQPASCEEMQAAQPLPHVTQEDRPTTSEPREKAAAAAQETYRDATCSMERMFEELEAGIVPRPDALRIVVANVLSRVLADGTSMLSLLSLQKMKRFDRTLASHALDVCTLSLIVGQTYGVAEQELETLGTGALLHDIGYVRLPRNLYRRIHDLTEQECMMMRQHPALGLAMLRDAQEDRDTVVRIVSEHHESINGSGFPNQLKGASVSVLAQLVGLVDAYDGMVSRRGGHPAMLPHDAIRQLFHLGDTGQYATDLIQAMIGSLGVYPIGSLVLLNTAEQAVVVGMNHTQRLKPVIKVITGSHGGSYLTPIRVDLGAQAAGTSARTITKVLDPLHERVNVAMFLDGIHEEAV
jgi:putative nucleotidyltransferase with HDIG domain